MASGIAEYAMFGSPEHGDMGVPEEEHLRAGHGNEGVHCGEVLFPRLGRQVRVEVEAVSVEEERRAGPEGNAQPLGIGRGPVLVP